jgi:hypothetical protein
MSSLLRPGRVRCVSEFNLTHLQDKLDVGENSCGCQTLLSSLRRFLHPNLRRYVPVHCWHYNCLVVRSREIFLQKVVPWLGLKLRRQ